MRAPHGIVRPSLFLGFLVQSIRLYIWFHRGEELGPLQTVKIGVNLSGGKQPPDFSNEVRQVLREQAILLGDRHKAEKFLFDQIIEGAFQSQSVRGCLPLPRTVRPRSCGIP